MRIAEDLTGKLSKKDQLFALTDGQAVRAGVSVT